MSLFRRKAVASVPGPPIVTGPMPPSVQPETPVTSTVPLDRRASDKVPNGSDAVRVTVRVPSHLVSAFRAQVNSGRSQAEALYHVIKEAPCPICGETLTLPPAPEGPPPIPEDLLTDLRFLQSRLCEPGPWRGPGTLAWSRKAVPGHVVLTWKKDE